LTEGFTIVVGVDQEKFLSNCAEVVEVVYWFPPEVNGELQEIETRLVWFVAPGTPE
jgi:hypothetical protein